MKRAHTIAAQEQRLAIMMLLPAIAIVLAIVIFPVLINFWISAKTVKLGDLRPPAVLVRRQIKNIVSTDNTSTQEVTVRYILRNSSMAKPLRDIKITDSIPSGYRPRVLPVGATIVDDALHLNYPIWEAGYNNSIDIIFDIHPSSNTGVLSEWDTRALQTTYKSNNILTNAQFTIANYTEILRSNDFFSSLLNTIIYTFGGASGAILLGLCMALLVNREFFARGVLRVLFLFPYVAPVIAVAFTWQFLLDPLNGFINAMLQKFNIIDTNIPFLSQRPTAMLSVITFDAWRYSPFAYLFILARLQAVPKELYESATVDGAGVVRMFWNITLPQISGIIGTIFLLRFIWTFNRFDDIFLLTGGSAGTKTLPIAVYDNAFGRNDIGSAAATAVLLFLILCLFLVIYLQFVDRKVNNDEA